MIVFHKAKRLDNGTEIKGLLTIMWGQYHIIQGNDENTAYPVEEKTIKPCIDIATIIGIKHNKRKKLLIGVLCLVGIVSLIYFIETIPPIAFIVVGIMFAYLFSDLAR